MRLSFRLPVEITREEDGIVRVEVETAKNEVQPHARVEFETDKKELW